MGEYSFLYRRERSSTSTLHTKPVASHSRVFQLWQSSFLPHLFVRSMQVRIDATPALFFWIAFSIQMFLAPKSRKVWLEWNPWRIFKINVALAELIEQSVLLPVLFRSKAYFLPKQLSILTVVDSRNTYVSREIINR